MKKFVITLLLIAVTLTSALAINLAHASGTPTITVDSATQQFPSANVGDTIQVNITISNVQNLWLWDINGIGFNPAMLSLTKVSEGPFLQQAGSTMFIPSFDSYQASQGQIPDLADALTEQAGASGSGVLATLTFKVLLTGTSQITFNQTNLEDSSQISNPANPVTMNSVAINADITVGTSSTSTPSPSSSSPATSNTPSPTAPSTASPTGTQSNGATVDPTATGHTLGVPEFPVMPVLISLIVAATFLILLAARKKDQTK